MASTIGFLGLGKMGSAIAQRLEAPHVHLHVHDPDPAAMAPFVTRGATGHDGPRSLANACTVLFACLPSATRV